MDETYIKEGGRDRYLYRAVEKFGNTVDFLLTKRRMRGSVQLFLRKAIGNNGKPRGGVSIKVARTNLVLGRLTGIY